MQSGVRVYLTTTGGAVVRQILHAFAVACLLVQPGLLGAQAAGQATAGDTCSTFRRVWVGEIDQDLDNFRYRYPVPSPDGRYVTEVDWSTGDLALRDLETGELRRVTNKGKPWSESQDWAWSPVFSPDGSQVAYMWFVSRTGYEVRIINVDGSGARTVYDKHCWPHCRLEDWSDDGEQLLATVGSQETSQLLVISIEDGSHRVLKTFDHRAPQLASFSPDGRWVAYDRPSERETGDWDVYVISLDGDEEVVLVGGPEDDRLMGWMPDGGVLLYSDRASTRGIWRLPVEDGSAVGDPTLVRGDLWKVWPLGFSRDAYFYGVVLEEPQVQIASFDLEALAVLGTPEPVSDPLAGSTSEVAWSHDGRYLAYKLHRDPYMVYMSQRGGAGDRLVIRSLSGEEVREIDVALDEWGRINWTPDGSAVVIAGRDAKRDLGIFRLDVATEQLVTLHVSEQDSDEALEGYALSPDGTTLYFGRASNQTPTLVALDLTTDRERVLVTHLAKVPDNPRLSPDGQWIGIGGWS